MSKPSLVLDERGWLHPARHVPSPNADARPPGTRISLVVVHSITVPPGGRQSTDIERLFTNRLDPGDHPAFVALARVRVSAHLLVDRSGGLTQFVSCLDRAWHAGRSSWRGRESCNDYSVGIELVGGEFEPFTAAQYRVLRQVVDLLARALGADNICGHEEIAAGRKFDPGPYFDWNLVVRDTQRIETTG